VLAAFVDGLHPAHVFRTSHCWKTPAEIDTLVKDDVTDDPVFGRMSRLTIEGILERRKMRCRKRSVDLRRWSRGGIHIDVPEDRLRLLDIEAERT
jgi:hypothetical protein